MSLSAFCRLTAVLVFFVCTAGLAPAQQDNSQQNSTDAVADAARKARAEQKNAPKPKKVFTNDDIPSTPPPGPASTSGTTAAGAESTAASQSADQVDEGDNNPKSEAYWRKRFQKLRDKISTAEQELDVLQRELNKDQVQYYNDPQKALMQQHDRSDINDKTSKVADKQKELDSLKQQLGNLEDELRKAGGDPGWAR